MVQPRNALDETPSSDEAVWPVSPIGRVAAPLRDQVLDVVRQGILDFRLRPGQRLIERQLMEQLGVSRATVREVVARLASEGLVTNVPQRGAIVSVLSPEEAADIYEMRIALEALAVQRFVERADPEQMAQLRSAFDGIVALAERDDELTQVLTTLQGRVRLLRWTSMSTPGRSKQVVPEIRAIVEAIEARNTRKAKAAVATHVRNASASAFARMAEERGPAALPPAAALTSG
jgi:DNA-binding GntR family transcriptional regulator